MSFRIQLEDCSHDDKRVGFAGDHATTEYGDAATTADSGVTSGVDGSGSSPQLSPNRAERRPLKVEFIGMEEMDSSENPDRHEVDCDFKRIHGKGANSLRYKQARMSLLGKPLNYHAHKRDVRYRRFQAKVYNFLERPKDWRAISYHLLVFLMVFLCLLLSVFSTVEQYEELSGYILYHLEIVLVIWFSTEFSARVWSAGCRSRYQHAAGRLQFIRRPLSIVDVIVICASIVILCLGSSGQVFATSALRGLRFFQILRMVRVDRRGGSWKLLGSVIWAHRQELFTTLYIGFLGLIFSSFLVFLAEKEKNPKRFGTYADALWWGVITLCTVGYGDTVPITWAGKLIAAFCAILGISFFALPAGILGSGFALKVQQQQRQKHLIRRRVPAATLIQCLWRCYAADENSLSVATWKPHTKPCRSPTTPHTRVRNRAPGRSYPAWYKMKEVFRWSITASDEEPEQSDQEDSQPERDRFKHNSSFMSRLSTRRRDRSHTHSGVNPTSPMTTRTHSSLRRSNSNSTQQDADSGSNDNIHRSHLSLADHRENSLTSLLRKVSEYKDSEDDLDETEGVTQLTEVHKSAIRSLRKIKYFVARRKFKEAFRPYDVKDVIEQYSAGHIDMLTRVKNLQNRLDVILGKAGSKKADVYESKISLASRVVKVERSVEDVESKLDLLLDMYKEDRRWQLEMHHQWLEQRQQQHEQQQQQYDHQRMGHQAPVCTQSGYCYNAVPHASITTAPRVSPTGQPIMPGTIRCPSAGIHPNKGHIPPPLGIPSFKLRSILIDKQQSEPNTPVVRNPIRPMHRNLSDLGPRIKKRVTYRCASVTSDEDDITPLPSVLTKPKVQLLPSEPDIVEVINPEAEDEGHVMWEGGAPSGELYPPPPYHAYSPDDADHQSRSGGSNVHLVTNTCSEGRRGSGYIPAIAEACRNKAYTSCNSTESDYISDPDDAPSTVESSTPELSPLPNGGNSADKPPEGAEGSDQSGQVFRLGQDTRTLLMRPEVLKLRKSSC